MLTLDRAKYTQILETEGAAAAITTLHRDMERLENESFEGKKGYDPALVAHINELREFSRELWHSPITGVTPSSENP